MEKEASGSSTNNASDISLLNIPDAFNFSTTTAVHVDIEVNSVTGQALAGVKVSFFTKHPDFGGTYLTSRFTDEAGRLNTTIQIH